MAIEDLVAIVQPPENSRFDEQVWSSSEEWLGCALPSDYRDFAQTYGNGGFCDGFLQVYCPTWSLESYSEIVEYQRGVLQTHIDAGLRAIPLKPHPKQPGLLIWGTDENGHRLHFLTKGSANSWAVIVESHEGEFEQFDLSMTAFLAKALRNEIRPQHIWHQPFDDSEYNFTPR